MLNFATDTSVHHLNASLRISRRGILVVTMSGLIYSGSLVFAKNAKHRLKSKGKTIGKGKLATHAQIAHPEQASSVECTEHMYVLIIHIVIVDSGRSLDVDVEY